MRTILALALAACTAPPVEILRSALPDERLLIDARPFESVETTTPSAYFTYTAEGIAAINGGVGDALEDLSFVSAFLPVWDGETGTATWGPWADGTVSSQLWAREEVDGFVVWAVQVRSADSLTGTWLDAVVGRVDPGATASASTGRLSVDLTLLAELGLAAGTAGVIDATYALDADGASVDAMLVGYTDGTLAPMDGSVGYTWGADHDGEIVFAIGADTSLPENGTLEELQIRSRWLPDGAGRADALVTGGDLGPLLFGETDCWDLQGTSVYYQTDLSPQPVGDAAACAFGAPGTDPDPVE